MRRFLSDLFPVSVSWLTTSGSIEHTFPRPPGIIDSALNAFEASESLLNGLTGSQTTTTCSVTAVPGHRSKRHCTTTS